ncbi:ABC transporter substrate-binding protein [Pseudothermotoga thermarum]|uniref:Carbohydrate ABC transporter substrate-binding protein, CUT1 family n=1 Tax=Pseudothermotoga thermarum DSM 5069 TaxID=688269 RepID=F7YY65_9THEM|nr:extracellular solute-binding protein [Pseudothermotoga thermarum]AEH50881.1 carbohydrate ABC transporter substrate-binding protein, CUT1 family [Pseudothermotoga thermarum DSM 5069]
MKKLLVVVLILVGTLLISASIEEGLIEVGKALMRNGISEVRYSVWSSGDPNSVMRVLGIVEAARRINSIWSKNGINVKITIRETRYELDFTQMYQEFLSKQPLGTAGDFLVNSYVYIASLAEEGYLLDISKYATKYEELMSDFYTTQVDAARYKGGLYGLPQDTEARPFYIRKDIAAKIGLDLTDLDKKVVEGNFTWFDVYKWAKEAVQKGASEWGLIHRRGTAHPDLMQFILAFGGSLYDPKTGKLVLDVPAVYKWLTIEWVFARENLLPSDIMAWDWAKQVHPAIVGGKTLFDIGGTWYWTEWQTKSYYTDPKTGQARGLTPEEVESWFYYTLFPAGEPGKKPVTLSQPFMWMISSKAGSQNPKYTALKEIYDELAFLIIAKACDPDINAIHSIISAHLPVGKEPAKLLADKKWLDDLYNLRIDLDESVKAVLADIVKATVHPINARFLSEVAYMLDYTNFPPMHPMYPKLAAIFAEVVDNVLRGRMQPDKAVEFIISKINADLELKQSVSIVGQIPTDWRFGGQ